MREIDKNIELVSEWTKGEAKKGNMCPLSEDEIGEQLEKSHGVMLQSEDGELIAYCRLLPWSDFLVEIGGTIVDSTPEKKRRRKGAGTEVTLLAIKKAGELFPQAMIFGLTENDKSEAMVRKMGGKKIDKSELPNVVWDYCKRPGLECAHLKSFPDCPCVPFDFTHLKKKASENK